MKIFKVINELSKINVCLLDAGEIVSIPIFIPNTCKTAISWDRVGFIAKKRYSDGIETFEFRGSILVGLRSEQVMFIEGDIIIKNPEQIFCRDQDRGRKNSIPLDPSGYRALADGQISHFIDFFCRQ